MLKLYVHLILALKQPQQVVSTFITRLRDEKMTFKEVR